MDLQHRLFRRKASCFSAALMGFVLCTIPEWQADAHSMVGRDEAHTPVALNDLETRNDLAALNSSASLNDLAALNTPLPLPSIQAPVYESLVSRFQRGEIFTASFENITTDSFTGEQSIFKGTLWLGLDRYRVETRDQILVVSDSTSIVLDRVRNRFIISDYRAEEDDVAPSRTLSRIDSSMSVRETTLRNGTTRVELESTDPYAPLLSIAIVISRDQIPVSIEAVDQVENVIVTRFTKGRWMRSGSNLFTLPPPDGAEILDLRGGR